VVFTLVLNFKIIQAELSDKIQQVISPIIMWWFMAGDKKMVWDFGMEEILGVQIGDNKEILEF